MVVDSANTTCASCSPQTNDYETCCKNQETKIRTVDMGHKGFSFSSII